MGANNADFHGIIFSHKTAPKIFAEWNKVGTPILPTDEVEIEAHHPDTGKKVGWMSLSPAAYPGKSQIGHTIINVSVDPKFRRQGIATGMLNYAKQQGLTIFHSTLRTREGTLWARSTEDEVPGANRKNWPGSVY
jgi:GNAT superfamily N-acetyltransferase